MKITKNKNAIIDLLKPYIVLRFFTSYDNLTINQNENCIYVVDPRGNYLIINTEEAKVSFYEYEPPEGRWMNFAKLIREIKLPKKLNKQIQTLCNQKASNNED